MRPIPQQLKDEMSADPYYKKCCLSPSLVCEGKIQFHHNLIFAGRQVNEKFCILPICEFHHHNVEKFKELLTTIMLNRATDEELKRFSKAVDYVKLKNERKKLPN